MQISLKQISPRSLPEVTEKCLWFMPQINQNSPAFIQLDWNLRGGLTRAQKKGEGSCLIPTLKRISADYVLIDTKFSLQDFTKTIDGMKLESVALIFDDVSHAKVMEVELGCQTSNEYPQWVTILVVKESDE